MSNSSPSRLWLQIQTVQTEADYMYAFLCALSLRSRLKSLLSVWVLMTGCRYTESQEFTTLFLSQRCKFFIWGGGLREPSTTSNKTVFQIFIM